MTAAKPPAPHGTPTCYRRGCRLAECIAAATHAKKRRELFGNTKSAPESVLPKLHRLRQAGASLQSIAAAAGCDRTTIERILNGRYRSVQQKTRDRILAIADPAPMASVSALGATRQVRAMVAARHSLTAIATASGLNHSVISEIANGHRDMVRATTVRAVQRAYTALANAQGASTWSANRARREGWAIPAAWDGIDMSDPTAFPDFTGYCGTTRGYQAHRSSGIPRCQPCKDAEAEASAERKARRAAAARQELAA